jgi:hypothetical protein
MSTTSGRPQRYRKKPVEVDAMTVADILELAVEKGPGGMPEWLVQAMAVDPETDEGYGGVARLETFTKGVRVRTKQGQVIDAGPDEWIVHSAPDDLWPVAAEVFEATYEPANDDLLAPAEPGTCNRPPTGWYCTRDAGHDGPCAAEEVPF